MHTHPAALSSDEPFVLLDDARSVGGRLRLYRRPVAVVEAHAIDGIERALEQVRRAGRDGLHAAGYLAYEAGAALNPRIPPREAGRLLWFGLFDRVADVAPADLPRLLPDPAAAWIGAPRPRPTREAYCERIAAILRLIAAGDLYQANFTFMADLPFAGDPLALYRRLRARQRAPHSAIVATGDTTLLSLSPELFFEAADGRIRCRPMKGTATRHDDPMVDTAAARELAADPKQRAENLMIVDLMRNDVGRIARPGSVAVADLFTVEHYPTVHQLVSTVTAETSGGIGPVDILATLFPCGSVTGAPKVRAMQVIDALEADPRGPYTGAIGAIGPDGRAAFNVAIRTLHHAAGASAMQLGLGSGIVADSDPAAEWEECLAKARFIDAGPPPFDLIETMRFEPGRGIRHAALHVDRLVTSAAALGFACDRNDIETALADAIGGTTFPRRLRLTLSPSGHVAIEQGPVPPPPDAPVRVEIALRHAGRLDLRLWHKTSDRSPYRRSDGSGTFETLFVDSDGFLIEGSFTNLFVERDGMLLTPPLSRGVLPGVLRRALIESGRAIEQDLRIEDCVGTVHIGNALRGLIAARIDRSATHDPGSGEG